IVGGPRLLAEAPIPAEALVRTEALLRTEYGVVEFGFRVGVFLLEGLLEHGPPIVAAVPGVGDDKDKIAKSTTCRILRKISLGARATVSGHGPRAQPLCTRRRPAPARTGRAREAVAGLRHRAGAGRAGQAGAQRHAHRAARGRQDRAAQSA